VKGTLEGTNRAFESGWRPHRSNCTGNSPQNPVHDYSRNALNKQADDKEDTFVTCQVRRIFVLMMKEAEDITEALKMSDQME
jgi:hypothetical protein